MIIGMIRIAGMICGALFALVTAPVRVLLRAIGRGLLRIAS